MRLPRILYTYIAREVLSYTLVALLMITMIMMMGDVGQGLAPLVALGISFMDVLRIAGLSIPMILSYTIPISFIFGMLAAYGRLSSDSEVVAMRAGGVGIIHLVLPSLVLGALFSTVIGKFALDIEAPARAKGRQMLTEIAVRSPKLTAGRFHTFQGRVLLADRDDGERAYGIFISDSSNADSPFEIFAEEGKLGVNERTAELQLVLSRGEIHLFDQDDPEEHRRISFEEMQYAFSLGDLLSADQPSWRPQDKTTEELREIMAAYAAVDAGEELPAHLEHTRRRDPVNYELEYYRRYAMPALPLIFPLICVPLGLRKHRNANSAGALYCLLIIFCYYLIQSFGKSLGERELISAPMAVWFPNVLLVLTSIPLIGRANRSQ